MSDIALDEIRRRVIAKAEATGFLSVEDIDDVFATVSPSPSQVAPQPQAGEPVEPFDDKWLGDGDSVHVLASPHPTNPAQATDAIRDCITLVENTIEDGSEHEHGDRELVRKAFAELAAIGAGGQAEEYYARGYGLRRRVVDYLNSTNSKQSLRDGFSEWEGASGTKFALPPAEKTFDPQPAIGAGGQAVAAVKPLEWNENKGAREKFCKQWFVDTPFGSIWIELKKKYHISGDATGAWHKYFDTLDAAKAAAQADYERRILSALSAAGYRLLGPTKFDIGQRVTKIKGSSWTGEVVGFYSTSLTPMGYAVESENEPGSVQIYPETALRSLQETEK